MALIDADLFVDEQVPRAGGAGRARVGLRREALPAAARKSIEGDAAAWIFRRDLPRVRAVFALGLFFAVTSALLWSSVFGYLLVLVVASRLRRKRRPAPVSLHAPAITVVLATHDEESLIAAKLDDLLRTAYPADRVHFLVVDGGSRDRTVDIVRTRMAGGAPFDLLEVPTATMKSDQVDAALQRARTDIIVVTDVDARLAPDCVARLVGELVAEPTLGAVAAAVEPATDLVEERLHWRMQNLLWWAEGMALDAAMGSAVALAFRRSAVPRVAHGLSADDAYIMMRAAESGGTRLCPQAVAEELRVPHSFAEFLEFRRRRGAGYRSVLERYAPAAAAPLGVRAAWAMRRWHFRFFPFLAAAAAAGAVAACLTPLWPLVAAMALLFAVSLVLAERYSFAGTRRLTPVELLLSAGRALAFDCSALLGSASPLTPRAAAPPIETR